MNKFLVFCFLVISGCKTSSDLRDEKLNKDPNEIKTVPSAVQPDDVKTQTPQAAALSNEDLQRELEKTKGELQEQTYLRTQDQAQAQAKITQLEQENSQLMGEIQILKGGAAGTSAAKGADLLWQNAEKSYAAKNYSDAASAYREFVENFPKDSRTEAAFIKRGQAEYNSNQFKSSVVTFGQYLDKFPKGKSKAMAWLGQGVSLLRLKQKKDAKLFLSQCATLFPKSKEAKLAKKLLVNPAKVPPTLSVESPPGGRSSSGK